MKWSLYLPSQVQVFQPEDFVRISENLGQVRTWQAGHGEWTEVMKNVSIIDFFNSYFQ